MLSVRINSFLPDILHFIYKLFRPLAGPRCCRFEPSCSSYALGSVKRHGPLKGSFLALSRLSKCHPWNPGGWDPVP